MRKAHIITQQMILRSNLVVNCQIVRVKNLKGAPRHVTRYMTQVEQLECNEIEMNITKTACHQKHGRKAGVLHTYDPP